MKSLFLISWRSVWRNKRRTFITVAAITFGLTIAIFFMSFADGMYHQMIEDAVRTSGGHFTVQHPDYTDAPAIDLLVSDANELRKELEALPEVTDTKAMILGQAIVRSGHSTVGIAVSGVEPAAEREMSPVARNIDEGEYLADDDTAKVVIGWKLAERLKVKVGKKLVIATSDRDGEMVEELLRVKGIFHIGSPELDGHYIQVPINFARKLYRLGDGDATQVGAILADPLTRGHVMETAVGLVGNRNVDVLTWEEVLPDLAYYVQQDRGSNQIFQIIIIFLSLFTIFNTILMSVLERTREFAVMLALGTTATRVRLQILCESMILATLGVVAGIIGGSAIGFYLQVYGLDLTNIYGEEMDVSGFAVDTLMHAKVTPDVVFGFAGFVFFATLVVSLLAVRRVKKINVATVLR